MTDCQKYDRQVPIDICIPQSYKPKRQRHSIFNMYIVFLHGVLYFLDHFLKGLSYIVTSKYFKN